MKRLVGCSIHAFGRDSEEVLQAVIRPEIPMMRDHVFAANEGSAGV